MPYSSSEKRAAYREANREQIRQRDSDFYEENRKTILAYKAAKRDPNRKESCQSVVALINNRIKVHDTPSSKEIRYMDNGKRIKVRYASKGKQTALQEIAQSVTQSGRSFHLM